MSLVEEVYRITNAFPREEQFGLTSQLRRAATSILANIAEGFSRSSSADKAYKYTIARGEAAEVHALLLVSIRIKRTTEENCNQAISLVLESGKFLSGLIHKYSPPSPSPIPSPYKMHPMPQKANALR